MNVPRITDYSGQGVIPQLVKTVNALCDEVRANQIYGDNKTIFVNKSINGTTIRANAQGTSGRGGTTTETTSTERLVQNYDKYVDFCTYAEMAPNYPKTSGKETTWLWYLYVNGGPFCINGRILTIPSGYRETIELQKKINTTTQEEYWIYYVGRDYHGTITEDLAFTCFAYGSVSSTSMNVGITGFKPHTSQYYNYVPITSLTLNATNKQFIIKNTYQVRPTILCALEWSN